MRAALEFSYTPAQLHVAHMMWTWMRPIGEIQAVLGLEKDHHVYIVAKREGWARRSEPVDRWKKKRELQQAVQRATQDRAVKRLTEKKRRLGPVHTLELKLDPVAEGAGFSCSICTFRSAGPIHESCARQVLGRAVA